uniref:GPI mannosyltransferase 2 n=1 Tax=Zea mays TaxID=4577 RepID=A0A804NIH8_MAIZE
MAPPVAGVVRLAAASRVLVLSLYLLARLLLRPYDTSATLHPPCLSSFSSSPDPNTPVSAAISSLAVWDGVHFARPAECGYEYEQSFAFLPLLPASLVLLARLLFAPLVPILGYRAVLVLSGYVLNNVAFVAAAAYFYRLSVLILKDQKAAYRASVLFCFNPASVFYSSLYSESLYALFSLGGIFYVFSGANTVAVIMLALSGSARSNGALNAGYFCFQALLQAYDATVQKKRPLLAIHALVAGALRSIFIFLPFFAFQAYGYLNICVHGSSDELRPWCKAKVPLLYGFIQSHYWGVGFLRYFQVKQLPNFLLASPVLSLAVYSIVHYAKLLHRCFQRTSVHKQIITALEKRPVVSYRRSDDATILSEPPAGLTKKAQGSSKAKQRKPVATEIAPATFHDSTTPANQNIEEDQDTCSILLLPFVLHLAFMAFTALFVMHVQVSTRFLSASPPVYWAAAHVLASPSRANRRWGYLICVYFIAYILLGGFSRPALPEGFPRFARCFLWFSN